MANKSPNIPDIQTILQMGINPKNGLPLKLGGTPESLYDDVKGTRSTRCCKYI